MYLYLHDLAKPYTDDVTKLEPLGIKSSDVSFVLLIKPHSPSVCSISSVDGFIIIPGIHPLETVKLISVPIGSVTCSGLQKLFYFLISFGIHW